MATFKVGQRVRIVGNAPRKRNVIDGSRFIGKEAVITAVAWEEGEDWHLSIDGRNCYAAKSCELAPLTDPKADAFVESLKKLAREPQLKEKEAA